MVIEDSHIGTLAAKAAGMRYAGNPSCLACASHMKQDSLPAIVACVSLALAVLIVLLGVHCKCLFSEGHARSCQG